VAFFAVHQLDGSGSINWEWLDRQTHRAVSMGGVLRHIRLDEPAEVLVDGSTGRGVILEP